MRLASLVTVVPLRGAQVVTVLELEPEQVQALALVRAVIVPEQEQDLEPVLRVVLL